MGRKRLTLEIYVLFLMIHTATVACLILGLHDSIMLRGALNDNTGPISIYVGLWMELAVLLALAPALALVWSLLYVSWCNRGLACWHCQTCGYDLTGNESGRCPECGTDIDKVVHY